MAQWVKYPTAATQVAVGCRDAGSMPSLAQRVKWLAVLQLLCRSWLQLRFSAGPGTSLCHGYGQKKITDIFWVEIYQLATYFLIFPFVLNFLYFLISLLGSDLISYYYHLFLLCKSISQYLSLYF